MAVSFLSPERHSLLHGELVGKSQEGARKPKRKRKGRGEERGEERRARRGGGSGGGGVLKNLQSFLHLTRHFAHFLLKWNCIRLCERLRKYTSVVTKHLSSFASSCSSLSLLSALLPKFLLLLLLLLFSSLPLSALLRPPPSSLPQSSSGRGLVGCWVAPSRLVFPGPE